MNELPNSPDFDTLVNDTITKNQTPVSNTEAHYTQHKSVSLKLTHDSMVEFKMGGSNVYGNITQDST